MFLKLNRQFMNEATDGTAADTTAGEGGSADEGSTDDWRSALPEAYRESPLVTRSKDMESFMQRVQDNDAYRGQSVRLPSEDASDEDRVAARDKLLGHFGDDLMLRPATEGEQSREFYQTLGMPEEASGYTMPEIEGVSVAESRDVFLRQTAHKHGLTDSQFNGVMQDVLGFDVEEMGGIDSKRNDEMTGLKADWGVAYDERTNAVEKFVETHLPSLNVGAIPPSALKELWPLAKQAFAGGSQLQEGGSGDDALHSRQEAGARIGELRRNKEFMKAYHTKADPGHNSAKAKMARLYEQAGEDFSLYA